ncbi:MAG: DUF1549 domain-containing protein, partial [Deltaproteobacteria bacterium]|nr:DUF1549 domain-containing protein [Deltaproteobacteria bacterium]
MDRRLSRFALATCTSTLLLGAVSAQADAEAAAIDFDRDVRPILVANCFACHGPDEATREAELRLDLRVGALEVVEPGNPGGSELLRRITHVDLDERMPPLETDKTLTDGEIATLRAWIDEGLPWERHWSFERIKRAFPPYVSDDAWVRNPIDRFVLAHLDGLGERRSDTTTLQKLLRRVTFNLTGLPPTIEELDAFLLDDSEDAYEKAVDRLLASPRYGEHMAAWWLDGARYADTNGYQNDFGRAMWPWRNWVIEAFNSNLPYDRFLTEQLAGDLLPDATLEQRIATGFNRNHRMVTEAGSIDEEWRVENVADRVETTSTVFLGLTMGCARCHDHKFDPITQRDYYRFFAYFDNVDEQGVYTETRGNVAPLVRVPRESDVAELVDLDRRRDLAEQELQLLEAQAAARVPEWEDELRRSSRPPAPPATLHVPHVTLAGEPDAFVDLGQAVVFEQDRAFS